MTPRLAALPWLSLLAVGCEPAFEERASLVTDPRILAVRGDPPESRPGDVVSYTVLAVTPAGRADADGASWAFCAAPKPLTENNAVSVACLGDAVRPIGAGPLVTATTPVDACALFGPDTPPGDFRPRDPDVTGGFYQPVRVEAVDRLAFGLERVLCNLPDAPLEVAVELQQRYVPNRNPTLSPLIAEIDGQAVALDALPTLADVRFEVGWSAQDAEVFPAFEPRSQALVDRREALGVSWYVTAGELESDVTGRSEVDSGTSASNRWLAPASATEAFLWVVLRDSRGGLDFSEHKLTIITHND